MAKSELIVNFAIFDRLTFLYSFAIAHDRSIFVKTFCHMTSAAEGPLKVSFVSSNMAPIISNHLEFRSKLY